MSKTVDDLVKVFDEAHWSAHSRRAGIAAVVRALRDEYTVRGYGATGTMSWYAFNEILGDAGAGKVAGEVTDRADTAASSAQPGAVETPATDPAPAVCVWVKDTEVGALAPRWWSACGRPYDHRRAFCYCGLPVKFTEAKT